MKKPSSLLLTSEGRAALKSQLLCSFCIYFLRHRERSLLRTINTLTRLRSSVANRANVCLSLYLFSFLVHLNSVSWEPSRAAELFVWENRRCAAKWRTRAEGVWGSPAQRRLHSSTWVNTSKYSIAQHKHPQSKLSLEPEESGQHCREMWSNKRDAVCVSVCLCERVRYRLHRCLSDGDDDGFPLSAACRVECCVGDNLLLLNSINIIVYSDNSK